MSTTEIILLSGAVIVVITLSLLGSVLSLWIQAWLTGAPCSYVALIGLKCARGITLDLLVLCRIKLAKAGHDVPLDRLAAHQRAGGRVSEATNAVIMTSKQSGEELTFDEACAADLESGPGLADRLRARILSEQAAASTPES